MVLQTIENYSDTYISVLWTVDGLRSPRHVEIDNSLYGTQKIFPPGMFVGTIANSDKARLLPRAVAAADSATSVATISVPVGISGVFVAGDVIAIIAANGTSGGALGTIASVNYTTGVIALAANTATAVVGGTTVVGVVASKPVGMISPNTAIDFTITAAPLYGAFTSASVVRARMPHWDAHLATSFPEITLKEV